MSRKEHLDAWLDKLADRQKNLEIELRDLEAREEDLTRQTQAANVNLEEARRSIRSNAGLSGHLQEQERKADAAGRERAAAARRELEETPGYTPPSAGRNRPGVVRV
jgi:peptidoglycan hydrolase CwlO-like protein